MKINRKSLKYPPRGRFGGSDPKKKNIPKSHNSSRRSFLGQNFFPETIFLGFEFFFKNGPKTLKSSFLAPCRKIYLGLRFFVNSIIKLTEKIFSYTVRGRGANQHQRYFPLTIL